MEKPRDVILVSGNMVDLPDRAQPRFPPNQVPRVTAAIGSILDRWHVGPGTTMICGGARGADLIAAEQCLQRGGRVIVCLAHPAGEFEKTSVDIPGTDWVERFRAVVAKSDVRVLAEGEGDPYARANDWMLEVAQELDPLPQVLLVWNGKAADGGGGTNHMIASLGPPRKMDNNDDVDPLDRFGVVDPTEREYEARQYRPGPKRLLSLDGGGIRGALSLEILAAIESRLRAHYGKPDLVLADYFDHIAGTSTGAIIAAALALGMPVDELRERYESLGKAVFSKRLVPLRLRSIYRDKPLREKLGELLGGQRTLGDPAFRSLLLMVMHNTKTDSPWLVSNGTRLKYNKAERNLLEKRDRNLDLPLDSLVRASTAAPFYFAPEEVDLGGANLVFQDGGITPYNNPALIQVLMATMPEYGLNWPAGEDKILQVSVGTGSSPAVHRTLRGGRVWALFNAMNIAKVFMNGASVSQDMLCRSVGTCRYGEKLDNELLTRVGAPAVGESLFSYLRYDANLSDEELKKKGVADPKARKRLRKLDAVDMLPELQRQGRLVGEKVDLETHFAGFLD